MGKNQAIRVHARACTASSEKLTKSTNELRIAELTCGWQLDIVVTLEALFGLSFVDNRTFEP